MDKKEGVSLNFEENQDESMEVPKIKLEVQYNILL